MGKPHGAARGMTRAAILRRLTVMQHGLTWTEAGGLTLATFDTLVTVGNEIREAQQPNDAQQPQNKRAPQRGSNGMSRTPIV